MKIQPITTNYNSYNNQNNSLSFKEYKHLGKVILSSGGIALSAIAQAFMDARQIDIVEVSTVDNDVERSKVAYNRLMGAIKEHRSNRVMPSSRERFEVGYVEPQRPKEEMPPYDPVKDYEYWAKRIYCYSDMM